MVFDIDGTREAARQRALPQTSDLPAAQRRLTRVCAPGYTGRRRGEVVRTRTVVSQAHDLPEERVVLRLDGQYGTGAVLADLAGFCYVTRGKDYRVLDLPAVQNRLHLPPDSSSHARKVSWGAPSTTALMCQWGRRSNAAGWWWRPIRLLKRRVVSA